MLQLWYAHVQFMLYRPFLHYLSKSKSEPQWSSTPTVYAIACINVSQNIIRTTEEMNKGQLLHGAYYFPASAVFHAVITLIFATVAFTPVIDAQAVMDRKVLASVAFECLAAELCTRGISVGTPGPAVGIVYEL